MSVKQVAILGSTGSIGVNTLDVIRAHPDRFNVVALTAAKQVDLLAQQCFEVCEDQSDPDPQTIFSSLHRWP